MDFALLQVHHPLVVSNPNVSGNLAIHPPEHGDRPEAAVLPLKQAQGIHINCESHILVAAALHLLNG